MKLVPRLQSTGVGSIQTPSRGEANVVLAGISLLLRESHVPWGGDLKRLDQSVETKNQLVILDIIPRSLAERPPKRNQLAPRQTLTARPTMGNSAHDLTLPSLSEQIPT